MHAVSLELDVHEDGPATAPHVLHQLVPAPLPAASYSWVGANPYAPPPPLPAVAPHPDDSLIQDDELQQSLDRAHDDAMDDAARWHADAAEAEEEQGDCDFFTNNTEEFEFNYNGDFVRRPAAIDDSRRRRAAAGRDAAIAANQSDIAEGVMA